MVNTNELGYARGNGIYTDNRFELLTGCKFYFEAEDVQEKLILEISGLSLESPVASGGEIVGSGKNAVKLRQATPTVEKFEKVVIKVVATGDRDLYMWYKNCNNNSGGGSYWAMHRKGASINAFNQSGERKARWELQNSYPCKYEGPSFKAGDDQLANETITLVHEGFLRIE